MKFSHVRCSPPYSTLAFSQVKGAMVSSKGATVLSRAVESGSEAMFEAVVTALEDKLTPAEVIIEGFTSLVFPSLCYKVAR